MRLTPLALAAALLVGTGCYNYQVAEPGMLEPGGDVRIRLSPEAAERFEEVRMTEDRVMEGTLVEERDGELLVETSIGRIDPAAGGRILKQVISVPSAEVREVETRSLDRGKTYLVAGVAAGVLAYIVAGQFQDGGGSDGVTPPGPPESRVPSVRLFRVPFPF